jgi:transposase-like protein
MAELTAKEIEMAQKCVTCPVCKRARAKQSGFAFWFVKNIEDGLCPYCKAYEKVYGKKAHERLN